MLLVKGGYRFLARDSRGFVVCGSSIVPQQGTPGLIGRAGVN